MTTATFWIIEYSNRHGTDIWPMFQDHRPTHKEIISAIEVTGADFEPDRGEWFEPHGPFAPPAPIPDGTVEGDMMFVGGATSIDRQYRVEDYSWWADEELNQPELNQIVDLYIITKPRMMVTHECPDTVAHYILQNQHKFNDPARTRQAFESMFHHHQPEIWVFGHWHQSLDIVIEGTRFICLNELEGKHLP